MDARRTIHSEAAAKLLASPLRLELLGQFTTPDALSVRDLAQRMGRPAAALHYHVRLLHEAGLLEQTGTRQSGKRHEALFRPVAQRYEVAVDPGEEASQDAATRTMRSAFRMAQRDLAKALGDPRTATDGAGRNLLGMRLHARLTREDLAALNERLAAIESLLAEIAERSEIPEGADQFCSLTILLAPLFDRQS